MTRAPVDSMGRRLHPPTEPRPGWTMAETPEWMADALCAQTDPDLFFPELGSNGNPAKAVCARRRVRAECLDYAMEHREPFGVWGGLSDRERRKLRDRGVA